jgi:DNA polymerase III delta prime subunit
VDLVLIAAIISILLSVAAAVFGANYKLAKDKVKKLMLEIIAAIEDNEVTEEELQKIITQAKSLILEF